MQYWQALGALFSSALLTGAALAMDQKEQVSPPRCSVEGGKAIPAAAGGEAGLCRAVRDALGSVPHGNAASVHVRVQRYHLTAAVQLEGGRNLPEINFAVMDAKLSNRILRSFAERIAGAVRSAHR